MTESGPSYQGGNALPSYPISNAITQYVKIYKHRQGDSEGYIFRILRDDLTVDVFVEEREADRLARYILFSQKSSSVM